MLKAILIFLIMLFFNVAIAEPNGYPGLVCDYLTKNDVNIVALQSDNYHGYSYIKFKDSNKNEFGGFLYHVNSSYNVYNQETVRIAMTAYLLNLKVNICLYEGSLVRDSSIMAIELKP